MTIEELPGFPPIQAYAVATLITGLIAGIVQQGSDFLAVPDKEGIGYKDIPVPSFIVAIVSIQVIFLGLCLAGLIIWIAPYSYSIKEFNVTLLLFGLITALHLVLVSLFIIAVFILCMKTWRFWKKWIEAGDLFARTSQVKRIIKKLS